MTAEIKCANCAQETDPLEMFPGNLCLSCWAKTPEGRHLPTAEELRRMFGGKR